VCKIIKVEPLQRFSKGMTDAFVAFFSHIIT
jgi:hypothetical protein